MVMYIDNDLQNKTCIIIDDIVDSGKTLELATMNLLKLNATEVYICCTHLISPLTFLNKLSTLQITKIITTNTIPIDIQHPKVEILDVSNLIANYI